MISTSANHLAAVARQVSTLQETTLAAGAYLRRGDLVQAGAFMEQAANAANTAASRLLAAGVPPEAFDGVPDPAPLRLDQLDTPDVRALLDAVKALVPLAERVDQARGRWYPDAPPTDTKGTDLAETLHQLACRLHLEAFGPSGKE